MKQYERYKNSSIYYLPIIPYSWKILKGKYLFNQEKREVRIGDDIITCFRDGQVTLRKNRRIDGFTNALKEIGYQGVRKGDFVIHNMDAFAGAIGISDSDGKCSPVCSVCTPKLRGINVWYYCYLLRFLAYSGFIQSLAKGIRERSTDFRFNDFKELYFPVPSQEEQNAIVKYIERQITDINTIIAQQQRMIELLNERKQIIIQQAVTKGLNPNVEMKDSGVEWIGQVPEHWEIMRLKRCAAVKTGCTPSTKELKYYESQDLNWFTPEDIGNDRICEAQKKVSYMAKQEGACKVFPSHIVYFVGIGASIGKVSYCDIEASANQQINAIIPNYQVNYKFLSYCLKTQKEEIFLTANTVTLPIINQERTGSLLIPIPPLSEQQQIIDHIEKQIACIDKAIVKQQQTIDLLKERKQIIINEVVTGKIKVI